MAVFDNPYTLGPTDNPRLLENRNGELRTLLDAVADEGGGRHALLLSDARTGRTSVMQEADRRLRAGGDTLAVGLRVNDDELGVGGLFRSLLSAAVEAIVASASDPPSWYQAWCDRLYLRDRAPMAVRDVLVSALAFAADNNAVLDPAVVVRDLRSLTRLAEEHGTPRVVVLIDDADALLEDPDLIETLLDALDAAGWHLILASRISGAAHLVEAASPVMRRVELIPLRQLWLLDEIRVCLAGPPGSDEAERLLPKDADSFLVDVLRLTSGNPFEIALVGYHLWIACRLGEQEHYELTPKVLDRVLSDFARHTGGSAELRAEAKAVRELPPERMRDALDLVALSELTIRQIAIARTLGLPTGNDPLNRKLLTCDLDAEETKVRTELEELEALGVVSLRDDGRFSVQGGRQAAIALKYHARSFADSDPERPFGIPFIACIGDPLTEECAERAVRELEGARRLASGKLLSPTTSASAARLRAALESVPFVGLELHIAPRDEPGFATIGATVASDADHTVAVVNFTVSSDGEELNLMAIERGPADGWVTSWNIAHMLGRLGSYGRAGETLRAISPEVAKHAHPTICSFFLRGRPARHSIVQVTAGNSRAVHALQLAVIGQLARECDRDALDDALTDCAEADPESMRVAKWVLDEFGTATGVSGADADGALH